MEMCKLCGHSLVDNAHGFDQNDGAMYGNKFVHSGHCTYCVVCNPRLLASMNQSGDEQ